MYIKEYCVFAINCKYAIESNISEINYLFSDDIQLTHFVHPTVMLGLLQDAVYTCSAHIVWL